MIIKGQILPGSDFAQSIDNIVTVYKPKTIVEIGTWRGLGSTKTIIDSIIKNNLQSEFTSIESNSTFYHEAVENLKDYKNYVNLIHGRIIEVDEVISFCKKEGVSVVYEWLKNDIVDIENNKNIIDDLPKFIDFLLLDGGEYSTFSEWQKLKDRTKIVAMDDTLTMKCQHIRAALMEDDEYKCIVDSNDRNGYSIFIRK